MSLSATSKVKLRVAFCTAVAATTMAGPGVIHYNSAYSSLSDDRAPVIGEAQYKSLSAEADAVLAKDRELFNLNESLADMGQQQIASPHDAELAKKIETATATRATLQEVLKEDFLNVTRKLLVSQGIAETDAVEMSEKFQNSYALKDRYSIHTSTFKLRNLDECQTKYRQDANAANQDAPVYVESCVIQTTDLGKIAFSGTMMGLIGGGFVTLLTCMSVLGSRRYEELVEQGKLEQEAKRLKLANGNPKPESKDSKVEITVRRR